MDIAIWICSLLLAVTAIQARSVLDDSRSQRSRVGRDRKLWAPSDGRSRNEWMKYNGHTEEELRRVQQKLHQVSLNELRLHSPDGVDATNETLLLDLVENEISVDDCTWVSEYQVDEILDYQRERFEEPSQERHRQKRKIENFVLTPRWKWPVTVPIRYKFDGNHNSQQKETIHRALAEWQKHTCLQFDEMDVDEEFENSHLLISADVGGGCRSFVGKSSIIPQRVNLEPSCLRELGVPIHEIGHALGFWHEQQRGDRDDYLRVLWDNIRAYRSQYWPKKTVVDLGVDYDLGSVMHYTPKAGSLNNRNTMETLDPLYQGSFGQRAELSFLDAKLINVAYCSGRCPNDSFPNGTECQNGGYQNPTDCSRCICPDGFAGSYCQDVYTGTNGECGGELVATSSPQTIQSPGYDRPRHYENFQLCGWRITAPPGQDIVFKFEDRFSVYCHSHDICYHWVEVRYKDENMGAMGPRFCCYKTPNVTLRGQLGQIMVVFKSNFEVPWDSQRRGFKATFYTEPHVETSTISTTTTTTTTTTTRTTPSTTTTSTSATTTTRKPSTTRKTTTKRPTTAATTTTPTTTTTSTTPTTTTSTTTSPPPTTTDTTLSTSTVLPPGDQGKTTVSSQSTTAPSTDPVWHCQFDKYIQQGKWCDMSQDEDDDFDWRLHRGATPSGDTGPAEAHSFNYYIYIEASSPRRKGDVATVWVPDLEEEGFHCISFYYHMYGFHVDALRVLQKKQKTDDVKEIWEKEKQVDRHWHHGRVTVNLRKGDRIGFSASRGSEFSGDIALDDIYVYPGRCLNSLQLSNGGSSILNDRRIESEEFPPGTKRNDGPTGGATSMSSLTIQLLTTTVLIGLLVV